MPLLKVWVIVFPNREYLPVNAISEIGFLVKWISKVVLQSVKLQPINAFVEYKASTLRA